MAQNTLTQNVETATTVIKEVKEAIQEKGIEIPEGTHATTYPGYIAKMTSQAELEEFKEQVVLNGTNQSEVKVSAPVIELTATEGNINLTPATGQVLYKESEIATMNDIPDTSDFINQTTNQTLSKTKKLYLAGSDYWRLNNDGIIYARAYVSSGVGKEENTDGITGVVIGSGGVDDPYIGLTAGETTVAKINFYQNGSSTVSSSIRETSPGTLSIPDKLSVDANLTTNTTDALTVTGTSRLTGNVFIPQSTLYMGSSTDNSYIRAGNESGLILKSNNPTGIVLDTTRNDDANIDLNTSGVARYNGNEVATIATFTTDSEAEAYSTANPTVLVISTQQ